MGLGGGINIVSFADNKSNISTVLSRDYRTDVRSCWEKSIFCKHSLNSCLEVVLIY